MDYNTLIETGRLLAKEMDEQRKMAYTVEELRIQIEANKIIINVMSKIYSLAEECKND